VNYSSLAMNDFTNIVEKLGTVPHGDSCR